MSALGAPLQLTGAIRLRNRFVATAHASGAVIDGLPAAGDAEYWRRLASGGAAMAIVGGSAVSPDSAMRRGNLTAGWRSEVLPGLKRRASAIREGGAVSIYQLIHLGRETLGAETYYSPVAPSAVRSRREPTAPRAIAEAELDALIDAFRLSAARALAAGFDGLELHAAHGYLLGQFLSPVVNRRPGADDVSGRAAPLWRIVDAIRELSEDTVLGIRLSVGDEGDAGLTEAQLAELLAVLHPGIQYVNLTVGMRGAYVRDMSTERPPLLDAVSRLRTLTPLPLLVSQSFRDPAEMQAALSAGADLVGMARALIADPDLPNKVLAGRQRRIRPCVACNEDCRAFDPVLLCSVNPELAPPGEPRRPAAPLTLGPAIAGPARRVAVLGAGPGGLECALALARDGDREVVLWEQADRIGGSLAVAGAAPNRHGWLALIDYYRDGLEDAGVEVRLEQRAEAGDLADFDAVVVATGAEEDAPLAPARSVTDAIGAGPGALEGTHHLAVVDDGFGWWPSVNAVELAVAAGVPEVTLITPGAAFAGGIPAESRTQLIPRLRGLRLSIRPLTSLAAAGPGWVDVRHGPSGEPERLEADALIVAGERRPRPWEHLVPEGTSGFAIGDAIVPRRVAHAIAEGRAAAEAVLRARSRTRVAWSR